MVSIPDGSKGGGGVLLSFCRRSVKSTSEDLQTTKQQQNHSDSKTIQNPGKRSGRLWKPSEVSISPCGLEGAVCRGMGEFGSNGWRLQRVDDLELNRGSLFRSIPGRMPFFNLFISFSAMFSQHFSSQQQDLYNLILGSRICFQQCSVHAFESLPSCFCLFIRAIGRPNGQTISNPTDDTLTIRDIKDNKQLDNICSSFQLVVVVVVRGFQILAFFSFFLILPFIPLIIPLAFLSFFQN